MCQWVFLPSPKLLQPKMVFLFLRISIEPNVSFAQHGDSSTQHGLFCAYPGVHLPSLKLLSLMWGSVGFFFRVHSLHCIAYLTQCGAFSHLPGATFTHPRLPLPSLVLFPPTLWLLLDNLWLFHPVWGLLSHIMGLLPLRRLSSKLVFVCPSWGLFSPLK